MRVQFLLAIVLCLFVKPVLALQDADVGTYAVVHPDGHTTDQVFRLTQTTQSKQLWRLDTREPDGSWKRLDCDREQDCLMREQTSYELKTYFPEADLVSLAPSCVAAATFAFCSHLKNVSSDQREFSLRLLVTPGPIQLKLIRLPQ